MMPWTVQAIRMLSILMIAVVPAAEGALAAQSPGEVFRDCDAEGSEREFSPPDGPICTGTASSRAVGRRSPSILNVTSGIPNHAAGRPSLERRVFRGLGPWKGRDNIA